MTKRICIIEGCGRRRNSAAGYCGTHLYRVKKYGEPEPVLARQERRGLVCVIDGCDTARYSGKYGWCKKHYQRWLTHGDPLKTIIEMGSGDNVTISAVHWRLTARYGPAKRHSCVDCGKPARHWCYDHDDPDEKRCPVHGPYSTNLDHYQARCVPCHKRFDLAHLGGPRTCSIEGCDRPHRARGWCNMHYKQEMKVRTQ